MARLIQADPERALHLAVPWGLRQGLPPEILALLEEPVSGRGTLEVMCALPEPGNESEVTPIFRKSTIAGRTYDAFVYGRREGEPTRWNTAVHGIALDNLLAVHQDRVRVLGPEEAAGYATEMQTATCAVGPEPVTSRNEPKVAESAGRPYSLCCDEHVASLNESLVAAEDGWGISPDQEPGVEASTWTEGSKRLILIRVDFPDLMGDPFTAATGTNLINSLRNLYAEMSYGITTFAPAGAGSEVTPTFRMPQPGEYYGTNNYYNQLRTDARNAAAAAGYVLSDYGLDVVCMGAVKGFSWAGLGYVGAAGSWVRNSGTGTMAHELGHNFGLNHANYWDTGGQSVIGTGTSVEYGDSFDLMGASGALGHFNARYKRYLNWLATNETVTVTASGVYRLGAHDLTNAVGVRGLCIAKNANTNYWVEFRQKNTNNRWLMNGAGIRWAQSGNQRSLLLDTTPGSTDGKNDSALVIGRTLSDSLAGVHITPVGKGGTVPETLDVVVNLGVFPANLPPLVTVSASATVAGTGATLNFSAQASDANGDDLAYYWDFGDGTFGNNSPSAAKSWSTSGDYRVRCTVTDMKGGTASDSVVVTIGAPTTYRLSGRVATADGEPIHGARLFVSTTRMTYTDSDGTYDLVGLPAGSYTLDASLEHYTFTPAGFTNQVRVGPNLTGLDFVAAYTTSIPPTITSQPQSQSVNPGSTVTFTVVATGSIPLSYQWRFNGSNLSGATGSSYTRSNVQTNDAGNYSVIVSNAAGTVTSADAALIVHTPPVITSQPQSQTVIAGQSTTFSVGATGSGLAYQWQHQGTNIPGATASTYSRANAQPVHGGSYTVVITNSLGGVTSAPAVLTVHFALATDATAGGTVSRSPDQSSYAPGTLVTLTAASVSAFPFDHWTGDASGARNPLSVTMTTNLAVTAHFVSPVADLIVDNPAAALTGTWATESSAPDKYATDYRVASASANSVTAAAKFTPTVSVGGRYDVYVWYPTINRGSGTTPCVISGSDGADTVTVDQTSGSGGWVLLASGKRFAAGTSGYVHINNQAGGGRNVAADAVRWVYSAYQEAVVPPQILESPQSQRVVEGGPVSFRVVAAGSGPLGYQWRCDGQLVSNATSASFAWSNALPAQAGSYDVQVSNAAGTVTSEPARLVISVRPRLGALAWGPNTQPQFTLSGTPGDVYSVESSACLSDWLNLETVTNDTGTVWFSDPRTNTATLRFYRARLVP
jgi:hypothetical protein